MDTCDQHAKIIQERISLIEKNFGHLCSIFSEYAHKNAALRDKSDELASNINNYGKNENVNKTLKNALITTSDLISELGDHRDIQVIRLESKVVSNFREYESVCKHAKEEVKSTLMARERQLVRKKMLERIREKNPRDRQQICLAESEALKASNIMSESIANLQEQVDMFEKKKLHDIMQIFLNFASTEIAFHAKALGVYTKIYREIANIDKQEDFKEFRALFHTPEISSRLETVKKASSLNFSFSKLFNPQAFDESLRIPSQGIPGSRPCEPIASTSSNKEQTLESASVTSTDTESNISKVQKISEDPSSTDSDD